MDPLQAPKAGVAAVAAAPKPPVPLDDVDVALLKLLAEDARVSQRQLAAKLGVSAPTVGDRMARLERTGVIRGYSVQIDWELAGVGVTVYMSITAAPGHDIAAIMKGLWEIPEVEELTVVTGSLDMIVKVRVRDHAHLRALLLYTIFQIPGVQGTETFVGMAEMAPKPFTIDLLDRIT